MPMQRNALTKTLDKFVTLSYMIASGLETLETAELNALLSEREHVLNELQALLDSGIELTLAQRQWLAEAELNLTTKMNQVQSTMRTEYAKLSRERVGRQAYGSGSTKTYELTG